MDRKKIIKEVNSLHRDNLSYIHEVILKIDKNYYKNSWFENFIQLFFIFGKEINIKNSNNFTKKTKVNFSFNNTRDFFLSHKNILIGAGFKEYTNGSREFSWFILDKNLELLNFEKDLKSVFGIIIPNNISRQCITGNSEVICVKKLLKNNFYKKLFYKKTNYFQGSFADLYINIGEPILVHAKLFSFYKEWINHYHSRFGMSFISYIIYLKGNPKKRIIDFFKEIGIKSSKDFRIQMTKIEKEVDRKEILFLKKQEYKIEKFHKDCEELGVLPF